MAKTRAVKQRSDRGSIKNIAAGETVEQDLPPTPFELRLKKLYESKDKNLLAASGFITTDYIADKNAIPLSAYRIRQIVDDIKSKSPGSIERLCQDFLGCIAPVEVTPESAAYWKNKLAMVKNASVRKPPVFRRASR